MVRKYFESGDQAHVIVSLARMCPILRFFFTSQKSWAVSQRREMRTLPSRSYHLSCECTEASNAQDCNTKLLHVTSQQHKHINIHPHEWRSTKAHIIRHSDLSGSAPREVLSSRSSAGDAQQGETYCGCSAPTLPYCGAPAGTLPPAGAACRTA